MKIGTVSGKRDSNSRPRPWQGRALPTELFPQVFYSKYSEEEETRTPTSQLTLPPQSSASTNSATSPVYYSIRMCPEQDSNLHASRHAHLKRARLPFRHLGLVSLIRADVKGRVQEASAAEIFAFSDAKVGTFFETCKFLACFL